jgi:hypothetical protein
MRPRRSSGARRLLIERGNFNRRKEISRRQSSRLKERRWFRFRKARSQRIMHRNLERPSQ